MLEGFMDVRTMARVLRSALDDPTVETLEVLLVSAPSPKMHSVVTLHAEPAPFSKPGPTQDHALSLELCEQETPALAILGLVMPRLGGATTAIHLRRRFPDLPILFTSGYSETKDPAVSQLSHSSYLQKPYSPTALGRAVRKILDPDSPPEP